MKATLLTAHGGLEMLRYGEAPDPVAGPGEVVVDIHAASVNGADCKVRMGGGRYALSKFPAHSWPRLLRRCQHARRGRQRRQSRRRGVRRDRPGH